MPVTDFESIHAMQEAAGAEFIGYGPPVDDATPPPAIVETFGGYELEYAVIRKGVGMFHAAQRGLVVFTGADRQSFLHRMLTNDTNALTPGRGVRAFLLGKTGRIVADMVLLHEADRTLAVLDRCDAPILAAELDRYLFADDVQIRDASSAADQLSLHGPQAAILLAMAVGDPAVVGELEALEPDAHRMLTIAGVDVVVYRRDETGSLGLHVIASDAPLQPVFESLATIVGGLKPNLDQTQGPGPKREIVGRGMGWLAYNTARIEAGTPLFHIDFGTDCLPAETGVLDDAVSFKKGCYLGQEIVARMHSLGHPKRIVVGLRFANDHIPIAGAPVFEVGGELEAKIIGGVTSSTLAPMQSKAGVAFAMMKWGKHTPGTKVSTQAEGEIVAAEVGALRSLPEM